MRNRPQHYQSIFERIVNVTLQRTFSREGVEPKSGNRLIDLLEHFQKIQNFRLYE
jgi:hypothetical protein